MPSLPPAYHRDAQKIAALADHLVEAGRGQPDMILFARDLATQLRAFLTRWQNQPAVVAHTAVLATFRSQLLAVERHIEALHVATLIELLQFQYLCLNSRQAIELTHQLAGLLHNATPEERGEMLRKLREIRKQEFDPTAIIADLTADLAKNDAEFLRLIDEYERFWPDRLDDPQYVRILDLEIEDHEVLAEELELMKSALADPIS